VDISVVAKPAGAVVAVVDVDVGSVVVGPDDADPLLDDPPFPQAAPRVVRAAATGRARRTPRP
jgi:hypothetical protein